MQGWCHGFFDGKYPIGRVFSLALARQAPWRARPLERSEGVRPFLNAIRLSGIRGSGDYTLLGLDLFFSMTPVWSSALVALSFASSAAQSPLMPRHDFHREVPPVAERMKGDASRFANLSVGECREQLKLTGQLGKAFKKNGPTNGVALPLRFIGPLEDVTFQVPSQKVPYGVIDCRQALLWLQLLPILQEHEIVKVRIDNFYRNRARLGRGKKSQHAYALASDVVSFTLKDGRELNILHDFFGSRGEPPCGPRASIHPHKNATKEQIEGSIRLRNLVCEFGRMGAFHHILTPNYNRAHENHLHLDIKRDNKWFSLN